MSESESEGAYVWTPSADRPDATMGSRWMSAPSIRLQKIFAAELLADPEPIRTFLNIQQISIDGMRIHADHRFEPGASLRIRLLAEEPVELPVHVEWHKELIGGMWMVGLRFEPESDEDAECIEHLVTSLAPQNRRRHVRVMRVLVVEVLLEEPDPAEPGAEVEPAPPRAAPAKHGTFTMDLSAGGMRILHDSQLPNDRPIPLRILLEYDMPPVEVTGHVAWQREATFDQYQIGIEFDDVASDTVRRIEDFVEAVLAGEMSSRPIPTQVFEEDEPAT